MKFGRNKIIPLLFMSLYVMNTGVAIAAENGSTPATNNTPKITIELNRVNQSKENCITYFLLKNDTKNHFREFKVEFIVFDQNDIISSRILGNFKEVLPGKTLVKLFGIPNTTCEEISKILINDVRDCNTGKQKVKNCLSMLTPRSKSTIELFK